SSAPRIDVVEPSTLTLSARRVSPGASPVAVTIDPSPLGATASSVVVDLVGGTWSAPPSIGSDGLVHASIQVPSAPATIVLHVTIAGAPMPIHPRLYVRP